MSPGCLRLSDLVVFRGWGLTKPSNPDPKRVVFITLESGYDASKSLYSGSTLNVARPDMNNHATLGVMLYKGIGGSKDFALWDLARRATLGCVLY